MDGATVPATDDSGAGSMATPEAQIAAMKERGTRCFKAKQWSAACEAYTAALRFAMQHDGGTPDIHLLFSNLSASALKQHEEAVAGGVADPEALQSALDTALGSAQQCCRAAMNWPKAYYRMGQALEARQQLSEAAQAYTEACRRCTGASADKQMVAALKRCGGAPEDVRIELSESEDLLEELLDADDKRLAKAGVKDGDLPAVPDCTQVAGASTRREKKQLLMALTHEVMQCGSRGDYRQMVEQAVLAVKLSAMLGEAPTACFVFTQLSTAYIHLRELKKAEAYARNAVAVAGPSFGTSILMNAEDPLGTAATRASRDGPDSAVPGLANERSSHACKTQA